MKRVLLAIFPVLLLSPLSGCLPRSATKVSSAASVDVLRKLDSKKDFMSLVGVVGNSEPVVKFTCLKNSGNEMLYQNTAKFPYHLNFLNATFPEYKSLNMSGFENLIFSDPPTLLAGGLYWLDSFTAPDLSEPGIIGFSVYFRSEGSSQVFKPEYVKMVHTRLSETIKFPADKIAYIFDSAQAFFKNRNALKELGVRSYPVNAIIGKGDRPRTYNAAKSYGYLKAITPQEFGDGNYSSKDILLFSEVPLDIGPVAGVITAVPQIPHSHVIFRSVNMKIPDIFIPNASSQAAITENMNALVEFETKSDGSFSIRGSKEVPNLSSLAEEYFRSRVPTLPEPRANLQEANFFRFTEQTPDVGLLGSYGSKGTNFALLDSELRNKGVDRTFTKGSFLVPYSFYNTHVGQKLSADVCKSITKKCTFGDLCSEPVRLCTEVSGRGGTLRDFIGTMTTPERVQQILASGKIRKASIFAIQRAIQKNPLDQRSYSTIRSEMAARWPATTRIRLRSSSNAEDLPGLTGAGLYTSHSACLADVDDDSPTPSKCMTPLEKQRTQDRIGKLRSLNNPDYASLIKELEDKLVDKDPLESAIGKVYASLWNERAFLSRDYYRIPHDKIFMAILVHPSFVDDSANGVVVVEPEGSGFRIDAVSQNSDISITNPEIPGAVPEEAVFLFSGGSLSDLKYVSRSNQVSGTVLSEAELLSLAKQLDIVFRRFSSVYGSSLRRLDVEFKRSSSGQIQIKQARSL